MIIGRRHKLNFVLPEYLSVSLLFENNLVNNSWVPWNFDKLYEREDNDLVKKEKEFQVLSIYSEYFSQTIKSWIVWGERVYVELLYGNSLEVYEKIDPGTESCILVPKEHMILGKSLNLSRFLIHLYISNDSNIY